MGINLRMAQQISLIIIKRRIIVTTCKMTRVMMPTEVPIEVPAEEPIGVPAEEPVGVPMESPIEIPSQEPIEIPEPAEKT